MSDKLTRKEAKERTRQNLLDALMEVASKEGLAGLTTTKIARCAGVAQSSFYFHFEDMNDALRQAAEKMSETIRSSVRLERQKIDVNDPERAVRSTYEAAIEGLLANPLMAELLLSHRRDTNSPLGDTAREILKRSRREIAEDMLAMGLTEGVLPHRETHAALFQSMSLTAVEMLLDDPEANRSQIIEALVHTTTAMITKAVEDARSAVPSKTAV